MLVEKKPETVILMNVATFWDIAPCSPYVNRRFGGKYCLHLQGLKSLLPSHLFATRWFLARLIVDPEVGADTFLRNVGSQTDYMALYLRRWQHS
jgi:hypothetical protein